MKKMIDLSLFRQFKKSQDGVAALEFAILAIPFTALLFGIIELAIVFFLGSSVGHAMQEAAREIRTGQFQKSCQNGDAFKSKVCEYMAGSQNQCMNNLRVDVVASQSGRFGFDLLKPVPAEEENGKPKIADNSYVNTGAGDVVVVRAQYYYKLALPGKLTFLANHPGNYRVITETTAFRNEPFPGGCGA